MGHYGVQILGSTPHPSALFMQQMARTLVFADDGPLAHHRVRFVRSIKAECLDRLVPLGERHLRRA